MVKKIEGLDGTAHFDHQTFDHYHFICTKCNRVFDIPCDIAPDLAREVESLTGFRIASYGVSFRGTCKSCQKFN